MRFFAPPSPVNGTASAAYISPNASYSVIEAPKLVQNKWEVS